MHGVPLTGQVIAAVRRDPAAGALPYLLPHLNVPWVEGGIANPMDEALLADAAFPSGRPLPPSLRLAGVRHQPAGAAQVVHPGR
ncbi:hypothetical protein [Streptomyces sp. WAC 01325]|uniref:hypothetical protein n=1 Tax=Streptomyces sp. WAC 01325 TaxID=2203202 RepID=UPI0021AE5CEE|nr:hypothetical protein [Streptomyces sp. WAC 01325]